MLERQTNSYIERNTTDIIKGIALILMFFHHFFTFPDAWIDSVSNIYTDNYFEIFQNGTNLCVSIFAFLTGFFYYYNNNKTVKYSIKK